MNEEPQSRCRIGLSLRRHSADLTTRGIFTFNADLAREIAPHIKVYDKSAKPFK